jgi:hypothetical protein
MKKRIRHLRVPKRKSTFRITVLALVCACAVHGFFLFGFKVASIPIGSWVSREVLLWITAPRRNAGVAAMTQSTAMPLMPVMLEREPRITDAGSLSRYFSDSITRKEFPGIYLARRAGTVSIDDTTVQTPALSGAQQWHIDRPEALDRIMKASWRQMRSRTASQQELSAAPVVLAIDAMLPGGIRQVSVLSSSGSDVFDAQAAAFIRSLPFAHEMFISEPGNKGSPALYRTIIAVTIEAEPAK